MSNQSNRAPMTALEGFKILSEDVLPKLIKRIVTLEQGGDSVDVEQITRQVIKSAMHEVKLAVDFQTTDLRAQLLAQYDDQAKRLDELEKFVESLKDERAAKAKRLTGKRKKKEPVKEPEQYSMLEQAEAVTKEPPVVLEDPSCDNLIPQDVEITDAAFVERQIRAIAGVGISLEEIAAKFGRTVEQVQDIVACAGDCE